MDFDSHPLAEDDAVKRYAEECQRHFDSHPLAEDDAISGTYTYHATISTHIPSQRMTLLMMVAKFTQ